MLQLARPIVAQGVLVAGSGSKRCAVKVVCFGYHHPVQVDLEDVHLADAQNFEREWRSHRKKRRRNRTQGYSEKKHSLLCGGKWKTFLLDLIYTIEIEPR